MAGGGAGGEPPTGLVLLAPMSRLGDLARRYYPIAIAGGFLATMATFFPSTLPLGVGGSIAFGTGGETGPVGSAGAGPRVVSQAPASPALEASTLEASTSSTPGSPGPPGAQPAPAFPPTPTPSSPAPSSPASPCPIPIPQTGTPLDTVLTEVTSICEDLVGVPGSGAQGLDAPRQLLIPGTDEVTPGPGWVTVGLDQHRPTVVVGLAQGAVVQSPLAASLERIRRTGANVWLVLVPGSAVSGSASGGPPGSFSAWASGVVAQLTAFDAVAVAIGPSPGAGASASTQDAIAAVASLRQLVRPGSEAGLWWADSGILPADVPLWSALATASGLVPGGLQAVSFVGTTLDGCSAVASFEATEHRYLGVLAPRVVGEVAGVVGFAPSAPAAGCDGGTVSTGTETVVRQGAGPVARAPRAGG